MDQEILNVIAFVGDAFLNMLPFIILTVPIAAYFKATDFSSKIKSYLTKRIHIAILFAALIGSVSPLCSCGVIPVIASLLLGGVPLAPVMTFWIASPSMDPEIYFLSVSALGWDLATWRLIATFLLSVLSGYGTHYIMKKGYIKGPILKEKDKQKDLYHEDDVAEMIPQMASVASVRFESEKSVPHNLKTKNIERSSCCETINEDTGSSCCKPVEANCCHTEKKSEFWQKFRKESLSTSLMLIKFLTLAFILEALIIYYVPTNMISSFLGTDSLFSILNATVLGVPLYTSNIAALPMVEGMIHQGMTESAALAFLIAGPTTTIPAMAAVWGITTRKIFLLYISYVFLGAIGFGYLYRLISILF